jgi:methylmalonyl-CoA mutase
MVRKQQLAQLDRIKASRDTEKYRNYCKTDWLRKDRKGNLLEIAVDENRTTLGEISDALETVYGRYKAQIKSLVGFIAKK